MKLVLDMFESVRQSVRFQQMEIPHSFPKFPQIMAKRIVVGSPGRHFF